MDLTLEKKKINIYNLSGNLETLEFPFDNKISDIKSYYEKEDGNKYYFKIILGTSILPDDYPIIEINETINIIKIDISELLQNHKITNINEFTSIVTKIRDTIAIDPKTIILKLCHLIIDLRKYDYSLWVVAMSYLQLKNKHKIFSDSQVIRGFESIGIIVNYQENNKISTYALLDIFIEYDDEFTKWFNNNFTP